MLFEIEKDLWFDSESLYIVKNKENYLKHSVNPVFEIERERESTVNICYLSSVKCNLKCTYCYAEQGNYPGIYKNKDMFTVEDYIESYNTINNRFKVKSVAFFGGEPLLNFKAIKKFVEYLHDNLKPEDIPEFGLNSNGTIMNEEIRDFLIKYNIPFATSLDGIKENNDACRRSDNFNSVHDKVVDTIKFLGESGIKSGIQFTFNKHHLENYKSKDAVKWLKYLETLPITNYAFIAATTEDKNSKIDLNNEKIKENFILMCEDIADYCLNNFIKNEDMPASPANFASIIHDIVQRKSSGHCIAGSGEITISPDKRIYPCHAVATGLENGVDLEPNFVQEINNNFKFNSIRNLKRENVESCKTCMAKNMCGVFCKGFCLDVSGGTSQPLERCLMMQIFTRKVISFLAKNFSNYKENIRKNLKFFAIPVK